MAGEEGTDLQQVLSIARATVSCPPGWVSLARPPCPPVPLKNVIWCSPLLHCADRELSILSCNWNGYVGDCKSLPVAVVKDTERVYS